MAELSMPTNQPSPPELNDPQAEAVSHLEGPLLVFAGAGSGKTRVITYRIANLLATHRVAPYRILAVTFTNKAAGELKGRVERLAGADVVRDLWAGTFHSVCARLLRRHHDHAGLERSFVIYDDADQKAVLGRVMKELDIDDKRYPPRWVLSKIHGEKREGRLPDQVGAERADDTLLELFQRYQQALRRANAVDFEDLILYAMRLAEDEDSPAGRELRDRFRYILVDEFQDTNLSQYRLVRALAARSRNLFVVGDDDQSIYRWRGADVRIIRGFRSDFPDAGVVKLEQNYRSSANIVAAALGVIEPALSREPKKLWTAAAQGDPVRVRGVRDERDEAVFVVRTVKHELARGVVASQMAVFYRVHAQSRVLEEAFRSENLPYQIIGGMRFFERAEVKNLLAYLRLIDNPRSDADLLRVINVPARGIGDKTVATLTDAAAENTTSVWSALAEVLAQGELSSAAKRKLGGFRELIDNLREEANRLAPSELAARVLETSGYRARLREEDSAESDARLENLEELIGSIRDYEEETHQAGETPALSGYLERVSLVSPTDAMKDVPSVSMMTVHAAKGLEFTSVFLTGMEEAVFPYRGLEGDEPEELDEERRLAYVAVTRARQRLFITHAGARTLFGRTRYLEPSRFLRDLPRENIAIEGVPPFATVTSSYAAPFTGGGARNLLRQPDADAGKLRPGQRTIDREAFDDQHQRLPRPGDRVMHAKYGTGVVERVDVGMDPKVVAHFATWGKRTILARFLELD
jgi:DNA helicase II / ATP-dependent DNA helicase PcrA